jgi:aryl-alcohol dehydrogenase-like predicted oxidoreductase
MPSFAAFLSAQQKPILGLGLAALGRPGYINLGHGADLAHTYTIAAMERHAQTVLDAAWAQGIRYFDAARSYGRAEEFLGYWLQSRAITPSAVAVGSKWGYTYTANWQVSAEKHEVKEHTLPVLERQWQESQAHLAGYLQLYQIHSATLESGVLTNSAVLTKLAALKQSGIAIGLSLSGAQQAATLTQALTVMVDGVRLFDAVQATWNLLEQSATTALQAAYEEGLTVIVKEALANGRLTLRNKTPAFAPKLQLLEQEATRLQSTVDALALAAVLAQPWATIVLSGAATVEQVISNVHALTVKWDTEATAALSSLKEAPERYWTQRSDLAWN